MSYIRLVVTIRRPDAEVSIVRGYDHNQDLRFECGVPNAMAEEIMRLQKLDAPEDNKKHMAGCQKDTDHKGHCYALDDSGKKEKPKLRDFEYDDPAKKPPLGILPLVNHNLDRARALVAAIERYFDAGFKPKQEWFNELNHLLGNIFS